MKVNLVVRLVRIFLAAVFLIAGLLKVYNPTAFLEDIQSFALLPYTLAWGTAFLLPWIEILCGFTLVRHKQPYGSQWILFAITIGFIAALLVSAARGLDIDCGCFGDWLVFPNLAVHIGFNILLAGLLAGLIIHGARTFASRPAIEAEG